MHAGYEWYSGSTRFTILHPTADFVPADPNSGSMCILAEICGHTLLIPGDVQGAGEKELTEVIGEALGSRRLDVYITAHHGSSGNTTAEFLEASHPRLAINSAGLNNRYGHPDPETLERLRSSGCTSLTLYDTGAITLTFSGNDIKIQLYRKENV